MGKIVQDYLTASCVFQFCGIKWKKDCTNILSAKIFEHLKDFSSSQIKRLLIVRPLVHGAHGDVFIALHSGANHRLAFAFLPRVNKVHQPVENQALERIYQCYE